MRIRLALPIHSPWIGFLICERVHFAVALFRHQIRGLFGCCSPSQHGRNIRSCSHLMALTDKDLCQSCQHGFHHSRVRCLGFISSMVFDSHRTKLMLPLRSFSTLTSFSRLSMMTSSYLLAFLCSFSISLSIFNFFFSASMARISALMLRSSLLL